MKLMTAIRLLGFCEAAWAQNPDVIQDTRTTMKLVQQKKALDSDAALAASQPNASKPAPSQPAKAAPAKASPTSKPITALPPVPKRANANKQVSAKANAGKTPGAHKTPPAIKSAAAPKADAKSASANPKSVARKSHPKQRIAVERSEEHTSELQS